MRRKSLLVTGFMIILVLPAVISSLWGDSLYLKDGQTVEGTYLGGNSRTIRFRVDGVNRSYPISDVDEIQFSESATGSAQRFATFENALIRVRYPNNWQVFREGDSVTFAPSGGKVQDRNGNPALAFGVTVDIFQLRASSYYQQLQPPSDQASESLEAETDQLINDLRQSNRNLRMLGLRRSIQISGERALSMRLTNDSPLGGLETNWLITVQRPEGLLYVIFTAQDREFHSYEPVFQQMLDSLRLNG